MHFLALIESKRDGQPLNAAQLREIVSGVFTGKIPDYQLASFLMTVFFRGLNTEETTALGRAAGNWLEVKESVACLDGKGPKDL